MKNEHIVWAYGDGEDGHQVVIIGLTATGLDYLRAAPGSTLIAIPPPGVRFADVSQVIVFHEASKEAIKAVLRQSGMVFKEG